MLVTLPVHLLAISLPVALIVACGVGIGARRDEDVVAHGFGWANRVTSLRAILVVAVAALLPVAHDGPVRRALVVLASLVLLLDLVDGRVARRTGRVTRFGARFDMETDALLILLLSVRVVADVGVSAAWVLLIGAARYLLWLASRRWPWLGAPTPTRPWAKAVAAVQGVLLTAAVARVLPRTLMLALLAAGLGLLVESFTWQVRHLRAQRAHLTSDAPAHPASRALSIIAALLVWGALVLPDRTAEFTASALLQIPIEAAVALLLFVALPRRLGRPLAIVLGVLLAVVVVIKALDAGFHEVFDRSFDPVNDWYYVGPGFGVLVDTVGHRGAVLIALGVVTLLVALLVALPASLLRISSVVERHRGGGGFVAAAVAALWIGGWAAGIGLGNGLSVSSASAAEVAADQVSGLRADLHDREVFARDLAHDPESGRTGLVSRLHGKDVLVVFIESYGRVAVHGSTFAPAVDNELQSGTRTLDAAGYAERSAYLTSPTFGGISWLAHSTLESGLWVDSQQRYDQLIDHQRLTIADAFHREGWRTVFDDPAIRQPWPQGKRFYHFDHLDDVHDVGYRGPRFSYATMPDQYSLATFSRRELTSTHRKPVMAEIDLISSHDPWTPLPHLVRWSRIGDGSIFRDQPAQGLSPGVAFRNAQTVKDLYGQSIVYTWQSLVSFLTHVHDPNLVVLALGDHQPHSFVSGPDAGHDVPVSMITSDRGVLARTAGWHWQPGLLPPPAAPVWRMDAFRDRFFAAFGT